MDWCKGLGLDFFYYFLNWVFDCYWLHTDCEGFSFVLGEFCVFCFDVDLFGSVNEVLVFFHFCWFIIAWVDLLVLPEVGSLILLSTIIKLFAPLLFKISRQPNELAINNPRVHVQLDIFLIHGLPLFCQTKHLECVFNQLSLNFLVKRTVCAETWAVVYFKQVWFAFAFRIPVKHDVETEDLETHGVLKVI